MDDHPTLPWLTESTLYVGMRGWHALVGKILRTELDGKSRIFYRRQAYLAGKAVFLVDDEHDRVLAVRDGQFVPEDVPLELPKIPLRLIHVNLRLMDGVIPNLVSWDTCCMLSVAKHLNFPTAVISASCSDIHPHAVVIEQLRSSVTHGNLSDREVVVLDKEVSAEALLLLNMAGYLTVHLHCDALPNAEAVTRNSLDQIPNERPAGVPSLGRHFFDLNDISSPILVCEAIVLLSFLLQMAFVPKEDILLISKDNVSLLRGILKIRLSDLNQGRSDHLQMVKVSSRATLDCLITQPRILICDCEPNTLSDTTIVVRHHEGNGVVAVGEREGLIPLIPKVVRLQSAAQLSQLVMSQWNYLRTHPNQCVSLE